MEQLKVTLDHSEHNLELALDVTRNKLLRLDMIIQVTCGFRAF